VSRYSHRTPSEDRFVGTVRHHHALLSQVLSHCGTEPVLQERGRTGLIAEEIDQGDSVGQIGGNPFECSVDVRVRLAGVEEDPSRIAGHCGSFRSWVVHCGNEVGTLWQIWIDRYNWVSDLRRFMG